jgi:hypothetical protein
LQEALALLPEPEGAVADVGGQGQVINIEAVLAAGGQHILAHTHFRAFPDVKFVSGQMARPNAALAVTSAAV